MNITDKSAKIRTIKQSTKGRVVLIDTGRISKKIILKEMSSDLLPVYRQLSAIRNRHFPRIYKLTVSGERLHVMKEYVEGKTLAKLLSERTFSVTEAIRLMLQLCEGVSCLHQSVPPIIHRDLTPWNILISDKAVLKIIDCDTARNYRQGAVCDTRRLGTFEYTPPEQFGFAQTDARSDIYSMGVLLYELVYCRAFRKTGTNGFCHQRKYQKVNKIITRCTMFSPDQRFQSVSELQRALLRALPLRLRFSI